MWGDMKAITYIISGVILIILVPIALFLGFLHTNSMPKLYRSAVLMQMVSDSAASVDSGSAAADIVSAYAEHIKSDLVLEQVVLNLGLAGRAGQIFNGVGGSMSASSAAKLLSANIEVMVLPGEDGRIKITVRSLDADGSAQIANEIFTCYSGYCESNSVFGRVALVLVKSAEPAEMFCMSGFIINMSVACLFSVFVGIIGMVLFVKGVKLKVMQTRTG